MLKKRTFIPNDKPVYREVIPQALSFAWKHPHYWLLGVFAAVLATGGAIDVFWKFWNAVSNNESVFIGDAVMKLWTAGGNITAGGWHWLPIMQGLLVLSVTALIILALAAGSCIAQGGLIQAIGAWHGGKKHKLSSALQIGAKAILPIAVLNFIIMSFIWLARFGVSLPLAMLLGNGSALFMAVYLVSFIVFFALAMVMSIIQIYALNAMMLQGATLGQAFSRAWKIFAEHWLVTIETIFLQALMQIAMTFVAVVAAVILSLPALLLYVYSTMINNFTLYQVSLGIFFAVILLILLVSTGFLTVFQYAVWTQMFRRFGEGGVVAKLHRWFRSATHSTAVPQS